MRLKEAAFIIGSMGGRPRIHPIVVHKKGSYGGGIFIETFYLLQEDGISRIILEDDSGFLELEF